MLEPAFVGRKVLITQGHLVRFQGSEIVTLELAEYIASAGADLVVATQSFGLPLREEFERRGITVFEITDERLDENLAARPPDIAWIQHSVIPDRLLRAPSRTTFYFHHMSAHLAPEFTLIPEIEARLATAVLFESPSSMASHSATGVYDRVDPERLQVFGNPAPERFARSTRPSPIPRRLTVVSNHIPEELLLALESLRADFEVELIGSQRELGATPRRVDASDIAGTGAVITIGKTVQYAIATGTPVFVYDHFGGPGWLSRANLDDAAYENFSGRGAGRLRPEEISALLRDGFDVVQDEAHALRDAVSDRYVLPLRLARLLEWSSDRGVSVDELPPVQIVAHRNIQAAFGTYIREWIRMQGDATYKTELAAAWEAQRHAAVTRLEAIYASRSFRFARRLSRIWWKIRAPFRRQTSMRTLEDAVSRRTTPRPTP